MLIPILAVLTGCCRCGESDSEHPAKKESAVANIALTDSDGHACDPLADDGRRATVLLFLMNDCPVANASAPAIAQVVADFSPRGVRFYGVYATGTAAEINAHRRDYRLPFPALPDHTLQLARRAGATRVPEAAVFAASGELLYRGRIDDRAVRPGITRPEPSRHDLRLALETILAGGKPDPMFTDVVGCYLPVH